MDKYKQLSDNYFGFDLFEEILKVVGERKTVMDDQNFRSGVASSESAIARLRESYYEEIMKDYAQE